MSKGRYIGDWQIEYHCKSCKKPMPYHMKMNCKCCPWCGTLPERGGTIVDTTEHVFRFFAPPKKWWKFWEIKPYQKIYKEEIN